MTSGPRPPGEAARQRRELRRRFYKEASVVLAQGGFAVGLDGRIAKTPAGKPLSVASETLAQALAGEWQSQGDHIDPSRMPLTRIVNAALDRVADEMAAVRADIAAYAGNDLLSYRAEGPQSLVDAQDKSWSPLLSWAEDALGARLVVARGVMHVAQDKSAIAAIAAEVGRFDVLQLAALHTITTLTGSAIIAIAVARGRLAVTQAWAAAHVDEDWQMSQWGADAMAMQRRESRFAEMQAAAFILATAQK
jgi:chaperone required for assembly of F1-ATPase